MSAGGTATLAIRSRDALAALSADWAKTVTTVDRTFIPKVARGTTARQGDPAYRCRRPFVRYAASKVLPGRRPCPPEDAILVTSFRVTSATM